MAAGHPCRCGAAAGSGHWRSALGKVQQQQHVGDKLLGSRLERGPPGGWRNPEVVLARCSRVRRTGSDPGRHTALVDPDEALGLPGLQRQDGEPDRLHHERMLGPTARECDPVPDQRSVIGVAPILLIRLPVRQRPQAQRMYKGQPREPAVRIPQHLPGPLGEVGPGLRAGVRVAAAVSRVLEALSERDFEGEAQVRLGPGARALAEVLEPLLKVLVRAWRFPLRHRPDEQGREPGLDDSLLPRAVLALLILLRARIGRLRRQRGARGARHLGASVRSRWLTTKTSNSNDMRRSALPELISAPSFPVDNLPVAPALIFTRRSDELRPQRPGHRRARSARWRMGAQPAARSRGSTKGQHSALRGRSAIRESIFKDHAPILANEQRTGRTGHSPDHAAHITQICTPRSATPGGRDLRDNGGSKCRQHGLVTLRDRPASLPRIRRDRPQPARTTAEAASDDGLSQASVTQVHR